MTNEEKPQTLTGHIYAEFKRVLSEKVEGIEIRPDHPQQKDPDIKPYIVIQARSFDPVPKADGQIELAQAWEARVMVPIYSSSLSEEAGHKAREYSWMLGALFHDAFLDGQNPGDSIYVEWLGSEDDNIELEAQSFEAWRTDFLVRSNIREQIFLKWETHPENTGKWPKPEAGHCIKESFKTGGRSK